MDACITIIGGWRGGGGGGGVAVAVMYEKLSVEIIFLFCSRHLKP